MSPRMFKDLVAPYFATRIKRIKEIANNATKSEMLAWSEERVKAPIRWSPNTRCYNV